MYRLDWVQVRERSSPYGAACHGAICKDLLQFVMSSQELDYLLKISASADGGPRSRVWARLTLRSAPHRH